MTPDNLIAFLLYQMQLGENLYVGCIFIFTLFFACVLLIVTTSGISRSEWFYGFLRCKMAKKFEIRGL